MVDLLQKASVWLENQRTKFMTQQVVYQRGAASVAVYATVGTTEFQVDDGAGVLIRFEARDYLIRAADLVLAGVPLTPKRGDQIRETAGTQTFIYEVVSPGNGSGGAGGGEEPCWRWSDDYRQTLRIHTKLVAVEVVV